jgi:ketosteroid isomerase-like protein
MTFRHFAALLCVLAASVLSVVAPLRAEAPLAAAPAQDVDAVTAAHAEFWRAYEKRDLWRVSLVWDTSDDTISAAFPASSTISVSWSNIQESFRRSFSHNRDIKIDVRTLRTNREGDVAWVLSAVRFEAIQTQTGQFVLLDRMLTTEIYRLKDGAWKLVHYHGHYPGFRPQAEDPATMVAAPTRPAPSASPAWEAHERFVAAFSAKDLGAMFGLLSSERDSSAMQPMSPIPFLGPENVVASWKKTFADVEALTIEPLKVVVSESGSIAWITEHSQYHIAFKAQPDLVQHFHNVLTTYLLRKEAGQWQIVHYHAHLGFAFEDHEH